MEQLYNMKKPVEDFHLENVAPNNQELVKT